MPTGERSWVSYLLLVLGLVLAVVGGIWVGRAWSERTVLSWATGLFSLVCGTTAVIMGIRRNPAPQELRQYRPPEQRPGWGNQKDRALPLLGELLVHKYQVLTEKQLQEALTLQRERGGRLGRIIVAMGWAKYDQIAEALEDQLSYGDPWRGLAGRMRADTTSSSVTTLIK